jgi:hypothetical protein
MVVVRVTALKQAVASTFAARQVKVRRFAVTRNPL